MAEEQTVNFGPYRLDPTNARLWQATQPVRLTPKAFQVLCYLAERPGQLVTKDELFQAVWAETVVSEATLTSAIQEIRKALADNAREPQYVETVPKRGFRFIAEINRRTQVVNNGEAIEPKARSRERGAPVDFPASTLTSPHPAFIFVGREAELVQLKGWLAKAVHGERKIIFVTGEPGIGKTTVVDAFLAGVREQGTGNSAPLSADPRSLFPVPWVAWGQCIEHHGAGEAFLPILDAVSRLCRGPEGEQLLDLLRRHAPMWLVQLPSLIEPDEWEDLQRKVQGASQERMLREFAEVLEAVTAEIPLVLVLEDLHWSDVSTLDLLAFLARRREPARLLVLSTYRPLEMLNDRHPLKGITHELYAREQATELALRVLSEKEILQYLDLRLKGKGQSKSKDRARQQNLVHFLHHRTGGNPLFLVSLVKDLIECDVLMQTDAGWEFQGESPRMESAVPATIRHLVARQSDRLSSDAQQILEAASVAGMEFSAAAVSAALATDTATVERQCEQLAHRQQFLKRLGVEEWPDGTLSAHYGFLHALYQQLWHERVSPTQLQQLHLQIAERKEQAYGQRASEIAAELALHFEQGREYRRAVHYLQLASRNALRRLASEESVYFLTKAVDLLKYLSNSPERLRQEFELHTALGLALMTTTNATALDGQQVYERAVALSTRVEDTPELLPLLRRFQNYTLVRANYQQGSEVADRLLRLAPLNNQVLLGELHVAKAEALFYMGEFALAQTHAELGLAFYDFQPGPYRTWAGIHPGIQGFSLMAWLLWFLGYPEQAVQRIQRALTLARQLARPQGLVQALHQTAQLYQFCREAHLTRTLTEESLALSIPHGYAVFMTFDTIVRGWALTEQGESRAGLVQIERGVADWKAIGGILGSAFFLHSLAEAYGKVGQPERGLEVLAEAVEAIEKHGERFYEAELYRMKGELMLQQESKEQGARREEQKAEIATDPQGEAEACFQKAIEIARKQQAKSLELRATVSLARLLQRQRQYHDAHKMLSEVYNWFTEGFDTKDLQEAKALLENLGRWGNGETEKE